MKNILFRYVVPGLLLAGLTSPAYSQSALPYVFAGGGGSVTMAGGSIIDFTLGEAFIATVGSNPQFTQGFQQPSTSGTPLAVTLLDFTGRSKKDYNFLSWHTAMEKNNDRFILERSTDGYLFAGIGTIYSKAASGYSSAELSYNYSDRTMVEPVNYYRLKQFDKDGRFSYSAVVRLERNAAGGSIVIAPNPATGKVWLYIAGAFEKAGFQVTDITGRVLRTGQITQEETEIDMRAFAAGIYIIRYEDALHTESVKLVKQ